MGAMPLWRQHAVSVRAVFEVAAGVVHHRRRVYLLARQHRRSSGDGAHIAAAGRRVFCRYSNGGTVLPDCGQGLWNFTKLAAFGKHAGHQCTEHEEQGESIDARGVCQAQVQDDA